MKHGVDSASLVLSATRAHNDLFNRTTFITDCLQHNVKVTVKMILSHYFYSFIDAWSYALFKGNFLKVKYFRNMYKISFWSYVHSIIYIYLTFMYRVCPVPSTVAHTVTLC